MQVNLRRQRLSVTGVDPQQVRVRASMYRNVSPDWSTTRCTLLPPSLDMSNQTKDAEFPANLLEVEGDLLKLTEGAIVQQCNCLTRYAHGLSAAIAKKFPYGDPYIKRSGKGNLADCPSEPGSVMYLSNGDKDPVIVCMMAQWEMSKPGRYKRKPCPDGPDNRENRIKWFKQCLDIMGHSKELKDVNFPHTIGCGLAGGHWPTYRKMIIQYAIDNPEINVKIVRLV